jgi:hypothetical protein
MGAGGKGRAQPHRLRVGVLGALSDERDHFSETYQPSNLGTTEVILRLARMVAAFGILDSIN